MAFACQYVDIIWFIIIMKFADSKSLKCIYELGGPSVDCFLIEPRARSCLVRFDFKIKGF